MNSSGIKRGLAGSAVAALAVTGLPFFASTASAAPGDTMTVVSAGPARNGGDLGAEVIIRVLDGTVVDTDLALTATNSAVVDSQNTADQNAEIVSVDAPVNDPSDDDYDLIGVHVAVTTSTTGDTATFRIIDNDGSDVNALEASEARANASVTTAGAAASLSVSPASQSTAQGIETGDYTVTVKDAQGRTTQLQAADTIAITDASGDIDINAAGPSITAEEIADGTATFTVTPDAAAATGSYPLVLDGPGSVDGNASVTVTAAAVVAASNVDIVTGADSWDGFGDGSIPGTTSVRVDQGSIRIDIKGSTPNGTVSLNVDGTDAGPGNGVTFGGKDSTTVSTVLDGDGNGSLTITPDAFSVQENDVVEITGSFDQTIEFERAAPDAVEATQDPYFGQLKGSVDIEVTVLDQFGDVYTSGFVGAQRIAGPNDAQASPTLKPVEADGTTSFTFTDSKATDGQSDTIALYYFADQFSGTPDATGSTEIKWTTDGQGANFVTSIGGDSTEAPAYNPAGPDQTVVPLTDADADTAGESVDLAVTGAEADSTITISVDNGALILAPGDDELSEGESEVSVTLTGGDTALPAGYRVVGTTSGLVTVTTTAANRTETAQFTVAAQTDPASARNVTVSGPATVEHGTTQIPFTAVVTDAFGNPVVGYQVNNLNVQVTGPAQFQDSDAVTNAQGQANINVRVDADAEGDVTIRVQGVGNQFGAQEDRLTASSNTDDAEGLPASSNVATATTMVEEGEVVPPVKDEINLGLTGKSKGKKDVLMAKADDVAAGQTAKLFKNGKLVKQHKLNAAGDWTFKVPDTNGKKKTTYKVVVNGSDTTKRDQAVKKLK